MSSNASAARYGFYTPLCQSTSIRVMVVEPGTIDGPITATLLAISSPDAIQYDALSYVWGSSKTTRDIICDGQSFPVTINLYWALQRVRHASKPRHIWADAVCINQDDLPERNRQVAMMGK